MSSGDRAALVALSGCTGGTRWRFSNNWDTEADLSDWHCVEVKDDGRVVKLVLLSNNLKGTIPDAVGALTELRALYLIGNKLTGPIPEALGALKELAHLGLGENKLTGSIPAWLESLKKLQQLGLSRNQLASEKSKGPSNPVLSWCPCLYMCYDRRKPLSSLPKHVVLVRFLKSLELCRS
ncbi:unnamed protein product [Ectocarpus sp. 12 AP-2014]